MTTFLLGWCAFSLIGTLVAVALIRLGKKRQPEADDTALSSPAHSVAPTPYKH